MEDGYTHTHHHHHHHPAVRSLDSAFNGDFISRATERSEMHGSGGPVSLSTCEW